MYSSDVKKLKKIIGANTFKRIKILSILLFFLGILEFGSVLSIYPFINIIIENPEIGFGYTVEDFNFIDLKSNKIKFYIGLGLFAAYFFKTLLFIFYNYRINSFLSIITAKISKKIFQNNLYDTYISHKEKDKSSELQIIQNETYNFFYFIRSITQILSESILFFLTLLVLIIVEPLGILSILVTFLIFYTTFYFLIVKRSKIWGEERQKQDLLISKIILESYSLFKEIKIYSLEKFFKNESNKNFEAKARVMTKQITFEQLPRYFMEVCLLVCVIIYLFTLYSLNTPTVQIISKSLLFVAASYRLIPSINRVFSSFQSIKFYQPSVNIIYERLNKEISNVIKLDTKEFHGLKNGIEIKDIDFIYPDKTKVLNKLNLKIKKGDFVGIVGESGSGKSTLIDILSGLLKPTNGKILIDGKDLEKIKSHWQNKIAYVSQQTYLLNESILNNITLKNKFDSNYRQKVIEALHQSGLSDFIDSLEYGIDTEIGDDGSKVSGGQKQRIGIARAIFYDPEVYFFDEITSSLDENSESKVINTLMSLKAKKKTVFFITHKKSSLSICDYTIKI